MGCAILDIGDRCIVGNGDPLVMFFVGTVDNCEVYKTFCLKWIHRPPLKNRDKIIILTKNLNCYMRTDFVIINNNKTKKLGYDLYTDLLVSSISTVHRK